MILPLAATHARSVLGACSPLLSILASAIDAGAADIGKQQGPDGRTAVRHMSITLHQVLDLDAVHQASLVLYLPCQ